MPAPEGLTRTQRLRIIAGTLLRALLTTALLVALYYVAPMDTAFDTSAVVLLVVCLSAVAAVVVWQVRGITHSKYPGLRAIETLAAVVPLYILAFATTYFLMQLSAGSSFSQPLTRTDALYFAVTVLSTVGFGDITAKTEAARLVVTGQMILDLMLLGFGVRVFVGAVKLGQKRQAAQRPRESGS